jgi:hypothetical protein
MIDVAPPTPEPDPSEPYPCEAQATPPVAPPPSGPPGQSPDATVPLREAIWKLMKQGLRGFPEVLEQLSPEISAEEAEQAEKASLRSLRLLAAAILLGFFAQLMVYRFPDAPLLQGFLYDLLCAGGVIVPLLLVSAFRVHFAGRTLLPLAALVSLYRPPFMPWEFTSYAVFVVLHLAVSFAAGRLLDFGASTRPARELPRLRKWTLLALGLVFLRLFWLNAKDLKEYFPVLSVLSAVLCSAWGWTFAPWLERRANLPKADSETLRLAAMMRWSLFAWGKALAILLGLLPLILFLNELELHESWPKEPDVVRMQLPGGHEQIWFWRHKGTFLRESDLGQNQERFYVLDAKVDTAKLERIRALEEGLQADLFDSDNYKDLQSKYRELQALLEPYRVRTGKEMSAGLANPGLKLYRLAEDKIKARGPLKTASAIFSVEDQLSRGTLVAMTREDVESTMAHKGTWQWLLLGFGLMGFIFLWRRGGESVHARWLGIWLIGVGIVGAYRYATFFLPARGFYLWHQSLESPSANLWLSLIVLLDLITLTLGILFAFFVPCAALWVHMCWPVRKKKRSRPWLVRLSFAGRIALVALCMTIFFYGSLRSLSSPSDDLGNMSGRVLVTLVLGFLFVTCAIGFGLRRWRKRRSPPLDASVSILLLAVQVVTLTAIFAKDPASAQGFKILDLVLGSVLLLGLGAMIFRKDLLYVSGARNLSFVIAFMLLPLISTWSEEQIRKVLSGVMQITLVPEHGAEILWVVIAVALLPPLRRALEEGILYLSHPRLSHLRQAIEKTLEELVALPDEESAQRIREILKSCGVDDFVLYQRTGIERFEAVSWGGPTRAKALVEISEPLRRFLSCQRDFVELNRVALEWRFFFVQFELHRLCNDIRGRYLLPICLGTSLRAFLVVQESTVKERKISGSPVVGEILTLGLAAASLRLVAHSRQAAPSMAAALSGSEEGG